MLDHTGINVSDINSSRAFYLKALSPLGYVASLSLEHAVGFGVKNKHSGDDPGGDFWIASGTPFQPRSHIAFRANSEWEVIAFYEAALAAGGKDNGAPGLRPHYHPTYFAAFVLDPDGYNIEAVFHGSPID